MDMHLNNGIAVLVAQIDLTAAILGLWRGTQPEAPFLTFLQTVSALASQLSMQFDSSRLDCVAGSNGVGRARLLLISRVPHGRAGFGHGEEPSWHRAASIL